MTQGGPGTSRWVEVAPERIAGWVTGFGLRHGEVTAEPGPAVIVFRAADGTTAACHPPFPPLPATAVLPDPAMLAGLMAAHAAADRRVGVLLVRLGGYAVGVFSGTPPR